MSIISTTHNLVPFNAKTSMPFEGQRLAKVTYKTQKDGSKPRISVCVSVPPITNLQDMDGQLLPHIYAWLAAVQDRVIRARYEDGATVVTDGDISIASCIAWLDAESTGNRLTKEALIEWFVEDLADVLTVAIADKLAIGDAPTDAQSKRVEQMLAAYRDSIAALAGGKTSFTPEKAAKLQKAIELAPVTDSGIGVRLIERLEKMQKVEELEDLGL